MTIHIVDVVTFHRISGNFGLLLVLEEKSGGMFGIILFHDNLSC